MSLLALAAQATFITYDAIVANWANITLAYPTVSDVNTNKTLSWTVGGNRDIRISYTGGGTLRYRVQSGTYTDSTIPTQGITFVSGQTLNFEYENDLINQTRTVTITDMMTSAVIDTFTVSQSDVPPS